MAELNYKQVFDDYIRAGSVPYGGFKKEDLQENKHKKIIAIKNIFELAKQKVLGEMKALFPEFKGKVDFALTDHKILQQSELQASENAQQVNENAQAGDDLGVITGFSQAAKSLDETATMTVPIDVDFNAIGNEPPDVVYAGFYALMSDAVCAKRIEMTSADLGTLQKKTDPSKESSNDIAVEKSDLELVIEYISKKISKLFKTKNNPDSVRRFAENFKEDNNGIGLEQEWYDFSSTRDAGLAQANKMTSKAQDALRNGDPELASGFRSQGMVLAANMSDRDFDVLVNSNNKTELIEFAKKYAFIFLKMNNVDPSNVTITLKNEGELGTFYPAKTPGDKCRVNINVDEISKMKNSVEVAATLSHELRHSIDAAQAAEQSGTGMARLNYNITESVGLEDPRNYRNTYETDESYNKDIKAHDLLVELKWACYYINPNERLARIAELSALEFMKIKAKNNPGVKQYIINSSNSFISYQNNVITMINKVAKTNYIENLYNKYLGIGLAPNDELHEMFGKRFDYFNRLKGSKFLTTEAEEDSIAHAQAIIAELQGRQVGIQNQREVSQGREQ